MLISRSVLIFNALKWVGAAYLVYLGVRSLKTPKHGSPYPDRQPAPRLSGSAAFYSGFLTCLLNPKVTLFLLALFTQIIRPDTPFTLQLVYGATIVAIELVWLTLVTTVVSQAIIKRLFLAVSHWFERCTGIVLIFFGVRLALTQSTSE